MRKLALHHWIFIGLAAGAALGLALHGGAGAGWWQASVPRTAVAVGHEIGAGQKGALAVLWDQVRSVAPTNPISAGASGNMLPILFFSILLGIFIHLTGGHHGRRLSELFESLFAVMMKMTLFIIALAPLGVFGFMLDATAGRGAGVFEALGLYVLTVLAGLAVHALITLPLLVRFLARRSPLQHAQDMSPALLTAFSTASSNGTLPLTLQCAEERAAIDNRIRTALYEAVAVLVGTRAIGRVAVVRTCMAVHAGRP